MDWVLIIFGTQVIKKKRSVRLVFPDYFSVSYDYGVRKMLRNLVKLARAVIFIIF